MAGKNLKQKQNKILLLYKTTALNSFNI
jgi:hypothetical protein